MAETSAAAPGQSLPSLEEARGWIGFRVDEIGGTSVARVQEFFVDQLSGQPAWLVAKIGRFGKVVAIPFRDCAAGIGHIWVPHTREVIRAAPGIDPSKPLNREQELAICAHYGIREGFGRAGEVSARQEGEITSQADPGAAG